MATIPQYVNAMRQRQNLIAQGLGASSPAGNQRARIMNLSILVMIATVIKVLVDKGVVTDVQLAAAFDAAMAEIWPEEADDPR